MELKHEIVSSGADVVTKLESNHRGIETLAAPNKRSPRYGLNRTIVELKQVEPRRLRLPREPA